MKNIYIAILFVSLSVLMNEPVIAVTEEHELMERKHLVVARSVSTPRVNDAFNAAFGDGFGDYVLLNQRGVNILKVKDDLRPLVRMPEIFRTYCSQQYGVYLELSERMRQTLLMEMGIEDGSFVVSFTTTTSKT